MLVERRVFTIKEVARMLGISKNTAYQAAKTGQLPGVIRIRDRYMVPRAALEELLGEKLDIEEESGE